MKTRIARTIGATVLPWIAAGCLLAEPIGRPTPPPCTADGYCRPAGPWGFAPTQWRRWPGSPIDGEGGAAAGAVGSDVIGPSAPPRPGREDQVAPPRIDALDPVPEQPTDEGEEFELPGDTEFEQGRPAGPADRGGPAGPGAPRGPADQPAVPRPELPEFMRPGGGAPGGDNGGAPGTPTIPFGQPPAGGAEDLFPSNQSYPLDGPSLGHEGPPRLPTELRPGGAAPAHATRAPQFVLPASASLAPGEQVRNAARIPTVVDRTRRASSEAPPELPASLIQLR